MKTNTESACTVCGSVFEHPPHNADEDPPRACRACWDSARRRMFRLAGPERGEGFTPNPLPPEKFAAEVDAGWKSLESAGIVDPLPEPEIRTTPTVETSAPRPAYVGRNETIARIRTALRKRSGKTWSVTGGRGTAWGWIHISAQPKRCTYTHVADGVDEHGDTIYKLVDSGAFTGRMGPEDCAELAQLLGLDKTLNAQGESIPASGDYYAEYIDRAEGRTPSVIGEPYWD